MEFDFIVVGGGTAGCVLANRLSADPARSVLLLEAGAHPRGFWTRVPAGTARMFNPGPYNWGYETEPEPELLGRRIYAPRGKALGGSSLINGMVFVRGQAADFDNWARVGVNGWSWSDVLPAYRRLENAALGDDPWRGRDGELRVAPPRYRHPSSESFVDACTHIGIPRNDDFNGASAEGAGFLQFSIDDRGLRHSAAEAFLFPVLKHRPNLEVVTEALGARVLIEQGRAAGVEYRRGGVLRQARARGEVVLASGAIASPALLMRSGIGAGAALRAQGIAVAQERPGVGANLQDHFYVHVNFRTDADSSLNRQLSGWRALRHGAHFLLRRQGLLTMGASQSAAFVRARPGAGRADTQINFKPVTWMRTDTGVVISPHHEVNAATCFLHPRSRGQVVLRDAEPDSAPRIHANYLSHPTDHQAVLGAIRLIRTIFAAAPMKARVHSEVLPGPGRETDEALLAYVRETGASMHHWVGTCRMGRHDDPQAVVDERLKVIGVDRLRVIDASVMPFIPSANTNAATYMVAERGASMLLADRR